MSAGEDVAPQSANWHAWISKQPLLARELLAGGVSGGLAKTVVAPLERAKILRQTNPEIGSQGVWKTLQFMLSTEGIPGLFRYLLVHNCMHRGNMASVARIVPYSAIHWSVYEHYRRLLIHYCITQPINNSQPTAHQVQSSLQEVGQPGSDRSVPGRQASDAGRAIRVQPVWDLLAGSASGATATFLTYPLDLVRTRQAWAVNAAVSAASSSTKPPEHSSIRQMLVKTVKAEGLVGLYSGIVPTLLGILPYAGLKFYVYSALKQEYLHIMAQQESSSSDPTTPKPRVPIAVMLSAGGTAGFVAQTVTLPLDVVRRRMQVDGLCHTTGQRRSMYSITQGILAREGWRGLFAGLVINFLKVVPSTAVGFTAYDYLKDLLDVHGHHAT